MRWRTAPNISLRPPYFIAPGNTWVTKLRSDSLGTVVWKKGEIKRQKLRDTVFTVLGLDTRMTRSSHMKSHLQAVVEVLADYKALPIGQHGQAKWVPEASGARPWCRNPHWNRKANQQERKQSHREGRGAAILKCTCSGGAMSLSDFQPSLLFSIWIPGPKPARYARNENFTPKLG